MTGLPWIRFDTSLPDNPKVLMLCDEDGGRAALFVYCCSLAYSGKHGTDGFIPCRALGRINGDPADAVLLVDADLWDEVPGGWLIHGWGEFQHVDEASRKRREKAQKAAAARWSKDAARKAQSDGQVPPEPPDDDEPGEPPDREQVRARAVARARTERRAAAKVKAS